MSDHQKLSDLAASIDPKTFLSYLFGALRWWEKSLDEETNLHKFCLEDVAYDFLSRYHEDELEKWKEKNNKPS